VDVTALARPDRLYAGYIFDMDGTVYLGDHLLPGVAEVIGLLRKRGAIIRYLSNNPTRDPAQNKAKLDQLGLPTPLEDIVNTVVSTVNWLTDNAPDAVLFPIAEEPLIRALTEAGFRLSEDPSEIDIVIASYDRGFNYRKLQIAFDTLWQHKRGILVQTNPDRYCPFPGGRGEPDCAAIVAAIEACTGVKCSVNFGKPDPIMAKEALHGLHIAAPDVIMVGDRLHTDVSMGRLAGMSTALVLTGDSTLAESDSLDEADQPDYVLHRLDQLIPAWAWADAGRS
jgi:HAD superfamily hydrolase (TIGR01450 family)